MGLKKWVIITLFFTDHDLGEKDKKIVLFILINILSFVHM